MRYQGAVILEPLSNYTGMCMQLHGPLNLPSYYLSSQTSFPDLPDCLPGKKIESVCKPRQVWPPPLNRLEGRLLPTKFLHFYL